MTRRLRRTRRAEGLSEYTILLTIVMVCSVVGLISAGSRAMRQIAADKNLCQIEGKDCEGVEDEVSADETTEEDEATAEGEEETTEGEEPEEGSTPEELGEELHTGDNSGSEAEPTLSAWDQFWGPLASNPMVMGFAGIMSWWI